jgi:hypothetical protein
MEVVLLHISMGELALYQVLKFQPEFFTTAESHLSPSLMRLLCDSSVGYARSIPGVGTEYPRGMSSITPL